MNQDDKMALFCRKHRVETFGTIEDLMKEYKISTKEAELLDTAWASEPSGLCETCGTKYMGEDGLED